MNKKTMTMQEAAKTKRNETITPAAFKCPGCMMGGAVCSDCSSFDFTADFCDYHQKPTTGNTWACPAYYNR